MNVLKKAIGGCASEVSRNGTIMQKAAAPSRVVSASNEMRRRIGLRGIYVDLFLRHICPLDASILRTRTKGPPSRYRIEQSLGGIRYPPSSRLGQCLLFGERADELRQLRFGLLFTRRGGVPQRDRRPILSGARRRWTVR
jgi:hypothetical protein